MNFVGEVSFLNNNATLANITKFPFFKNAKNFVIAPNGFAFPSISTITSKLGRSVDKLALVSVSR